LEMLPEAEQASSQRMFLHAPKWTVNISPLKSSLLTGYGAKASKLSLLDEIDTRGEQILRQQVKNRYLQGIEQTEQEKSEEKSLANLFLGGKRKKPPTPARLTPIPDSGDQVVSVQYLSIK
jgi:hypothetical protein